MIEITKAQFLKYVVEMMMIINMSSIPPKVIRRKTCLLVRGLFKLSKDFEYKRHLNIERWNFFLKNNYKNEKKKCVS
jgi:hypothetical protein